MVQAIRGFKDILPGETERWLALESSARDLFAAYGYAEIRPPILESTEVFSRSIGETTDIVEKEMYTFQDRSNRSVTLRPEGTASVVRACVEHHQFQTLPLKLYYLGPMFRHERPQAGRLRQFHQIGVEAMGVEDAGMDIEVLALLRDLFERFGLRDLELQVSSLGCSICRPAYRERLLGFLRPQISALCPDCQGRLERNPLRTLDCKREACREATQDAPRILDSLCEACRSHFAEVREGLDTLRIPYVVNPRIVRGLDYYMRTAFELVTDCLGAQNAVAAGGRYDGLVKDLGGPDIPGIGFALGMERVLALLKDRQPPAQVSPFFVAALGKVARREALLLIQALRNVGKPVEWDPAGGSLKSQLRKADRLGARQVVILGEEEIKTGRATLRDMAAKTQQSIPLSDLLTTLTTKSASHE
ncbi:MAG: histidine--tRNA ligase [Nitrospirae bacterium]|nr:histidine--tRNA ligase [Nitrospirota bacterium]